MDFKYYVYIAVAIIIVLMIIYTMLTYIFPSISLNKEIIEVEFSETLVVPELAELGVFTYSKHDKELQNEIVLSYWKDFDIGIGNENYKYELNFNSNDKKLDQLQVKAYRLIYNYSTDDWQNILNKIMIYYKKYYSDLEDINSLKIENTEDLKKSIQLNSVSINEYGRIGMSFNCIWDDEHGLGINIDKNNSIQVGQASEAY